MDQFKINQDHCPLKGEIAISGAKNAALPELAASILARTPHTLRNVHRLQDVRTMLHLLRNFGIYCEWDNANHVVTMDSGKLISTVAPYESVKTMRASILTLGPLLARYGEARVSLPGGCAIGSRPVDQHINGLRAMGAEIDVEHGYIVARCRRLTGARIATDMVTVTGTENLLMAATLAEGTTIIENAACEPEVYDLACMLIKMGAKISGHGTDTIEICGVQSLNGADHTAIPDRIEAGTYLAAVGAVGGDVTLRNVNPSHLGVVLSMLEKAGAEIFYDEDWIRIKVTRRLEPISFQTGEYPHFPTDLQAPFMALNCVANGTSTIHETIFENRFMHVCELSRMGAQIQQITDSLAVVQGGRLQGASVMASDLRAGAALVVAALAAEGETLIDRVYHIDRGYETIEKKLSNVGANILRI